MSSCYKNPRYIGAKALFDPFFIPEKLINRSKEEKYVKGLLKDAAEDRFSANIGIYGMRGVGKTVLINKAVKEVKQILLKQNENEGRILPIYVNCESKEFDQILFNIAETLAKYIGIEIDPEFILTSDSSKIWNLIKLLVQKVNEPIVLFMDSFEHIEPHLGNKLSIFCKTEKIIQINSFNLLKSSPFLYEFEKPDFKLQLGIYSNNNLLQISQDRCEVAFLKPIDLGLQKFIIDLIIQFDKCIPGPVINILREIYPLLESNSMSRKNSINSCKIRDLCRYQFEGFSVDELTIADYINETSIVERIFLDNVCNYFYHSDEYYIDFKNLKEKFIMACESIEINMNEKSFYKILSNLENINLLIPTSFKVADVRGNKKRSKLKVKESINSSKENLMNYPYKSSNDFFHIKEIPYFLTISPEILNEMLNVAFGQF
ncbi:MAG: hypothetical protein ACTSRZ_04190 [Promethearchaeota archaeon]